MTFYTFSRALKAQGATRRQIMALDNLWRESAADAHRKMFKAGELLDFGIINKNDFHSFCVHIGREFVLDNIDLFAELVGLD